MDREWSYIKLYKLIPGGSIQAVIYHSGGGNDHTGGYAIYDLNDKGNMRPVFKSYNYWLDGSGGVAENEKTKEKVIVDVSRPWLDIVSIHALEPRVDMIFTYDQKLRKYLPANDIFYAPKGISEDWMYPVDEESVQNILTWASKYWFSGKDAEGWRCFDKFYVGEDKEELRGKIKDVLGKNAYIRDMKNRR